MTWWKTISPIDINHTLDFPTPDECFDYVPLGTFLYGLDYSKFPIRYCRVRKNLLVVNEMPVFEVFLWMPRDVVQVHHIKLHDLTVFLEAHDLVRKADD